MSYGRLNIWLREMDCTPKNVWKVELVVRTCGGAYLVDFNPNVVEKLKQAFPSPQYTLVVSSRDEEKTIVITRAGNAPLIKHLEVELPPGCYVVRAWVCADNLWSDREMVIVDCGETACVNLIIPPAEKCIRGAVLPVAVVAQDLKLAPDRLNAALDVLMEAGKVKKETFLKEITDLARELRESKVKDAPKYLKAIDYLTKRAR